MYGAADQTPTKGHLCMGLSPRVRGSLRKVNPRRIVARSIPTCAGQPRHCRASPTSMQVYPHVCGAASDFCQISYRSGGLSPRVRGSPAGVRANDLHNRSIPTCAGQPYSGLHPVAAMKVYPHVCGAAFSSTVEKTSVPGLSPRVRGSL